MDNADNILLLRFTQRFSLRYLVPLRQAPATAGCRRMLRDKYRMAPHRRLLTIIRRVSWRQSLGDKIGGVFINHLRAFIPAILSFFIPRRKRERNVDRARRAKSGSSAFISIPNVLTFVLIAQARRYLPEVSRRIQLRTPDGNRHFMRHYGDNTAAHAGFSGQSHPPGKLAGILIHPAGRH